MGFEIIYIFFCDNPEEPHKVTKIFCIECQDFYSKWPLEIDFIKNVLKKNQGRQYSLVMLSAASKLKTYLL